MQNFSIEIDAARFVRTLDLLGSDVRYAAIALNFALRLESEVKQLTPYKTGNLRRRWYHTPGETVLAMERSLTNSAPYGIFVEDDTKPHEIRPKNKKALAWGISGGAFKSLGISKAEAGKLGIGVSKRTTSKTTGKALKNARTEFTVFSQVVHHPGTKGAKMLEQSLEKLQPELEREINEEISRIWEGNFA